MNLSFQIPKNQLFFLRLFRMKQNLYSAIFYTATIDAMDAYTVNLVQKYRRKSNNPFNLSVRFLMAQDSKKQSNVSELSTEELDNKLLDLMSKQNDRQLTAMISTCTTADKHISQLTLKTLFRHYSIAGKTDIVENLQHYCSKVEYALYKRNGEFMHYIAKAQCMKGNSKKGLSILTQCYSKNKGLRSFYRLIFRELIQDSVLNRSEASLVTFKKYVLEFSQNYGDHYPLVCFWHICWSSSWFSDQMLANELVDDSTVLQDIIKDKATAFCITVLRQEYNEDAVLSLLQTLLKYSMMEEYVKVIELLFDYKLKNRDIRGCTEIIRNCEVLDITLPTQQQGRYIKLLIDGKAPISKPPVKQTPKHFKLKF